MGKPWRRRKLKRDRATHGPCHVAGCKVNGSLTHFCKVCEELKKAGKLDGEPFSVRFCGNHILEADRQIKKHILSKHPGLLPSYLWAKLTGNA